MNIETFLYVLGIVTNRYLNSLTLYVHLPSEVTNGKTLKLKTWYTWVSLSCNFLRSISVWIDCERGVQTNMSYKSIKINKRRMR